MFGYKTRSCVYCAYLTAYHSIKHAKAAGSFTLSKDPAAASAFILTRIIPIQSRLLNFQTSLDSIIVQGLQKAIIMI